MDLTQNYFELFGLPIAFDIDQTRLLKQYREMQSHFHPDKFASNSASEKRLAEQFSSLVNTAYQTLKTPLLTAEYLLALADHPVASDNMTIQDEAFLFQQMDWREALADIDITSIDEAEKSLQGFSSEVSQARQSLIEDFASKYESETYQEAIQIIAKLHFVEKMKIEIERLEDAIFENE